MRMSLEVVETLKRYLDEDIRTGDLTTKIVCPSTTNGTATVFAKSKAILAGIEEIIGIATITDLTYEVLVSEGEWVEQKQPVLHLKGPVTTLLSVERVCLNIIMRMSGIATKTHKMVQTAKDENPDVLVAATRKTTPGFRYFEKRAVQVGGGDSHRYSLDDMVLIKNNHIAAVGGVIQAVRLAKSKVSFSKKISCEVRTLEETLAAAENGADIILLDNFSPEEIKQIISVLEKKGLRNRVLLEASGGIHENNVKEYAQSGVDIISSGALTHSYQSADFNMRLNIEQ
jgi:nicotinate-nucleotide pyrophosphorylase (carboxylating)